MLTYLAKSEMCFRRLPLLDDLRALVEFTQAGFMAGAADRLYWTPSAITRQLQRLEAALGARGCRGLLGVKNGLT